MNHTPTHDCKEMARYCEKCASSYTPTPWILIPQGDGSSMLAQEYETGKQMNPKGLRLIAHVMARGNSLLADEANAAYIVRAVNCHAELLTALQALGTYPGGYCFCPEGRDAGEVNAFGNAHTGECEDARKAIANAESA